MLPTSDESNRRHELVYLHKALVCRDISGASKTEGKSTDWSEVKAKYLLDTIRHIKLRQRLVSMAPRVNPLCQVFLEPDELHNTDSFSVQPLPPMNLYAVKKQQKRIAALLSADREASENHATNKQRRDLIKKRMNNIVQASSSKSSKKHKQKYDASVNFYLKDFYEKNEMGLPQSGEEQATLSELDDDMLAKEDSAHILGSGLPSMTISVKHHPVLKSRKSRNSVASNKSILEQVERLRQLRRASGPDPIGGEDKIYSLISKNSSTTFSKKSQETAYYRPLVMKEHTIPLAARDSINYPSRLSGLTTTLLSSSMTSQAQPPLLDNYVTGIREETASQELSCDDLNNVNTSNGLKDSTDLKDSTSEEKVVEGEEHQGFREIQAELRIKKRLRSGLSHSLTSPAILEDVPESGQASFDKPNNLRDNLSIRRSRNRALQITEAKSSFQADVEDISSDTDFLDSNLLNSLLYYDGSMSGPLPVIPSIDVTDSSYTNTNDLSRPVSQSRPISEMDSNPAIRSFTESARTKSLIGGAFYLADAKQFRKARHPRRLHTPSPRHSISISRPSSAERIPSRDGECMCTNSARKPKVYQSCKLCYKTFQHRHWCENRTNAKEPHCEVCGGVIIGLRTPSPPHDADDDTLTVISSPSEMDLELNNSDDTGSDFEDDKRNADRKLMTLNKLGELDEISASANFDDTLPNIPAIRLDHEEKWRDDEQKGRRSPSETSSRKMSRVVSPDTMMERIESMLSSGAYDVNFNSNLSRSAIGSSSFERASPRKISINDEGTRENNSTKHIDAVAEPPKIVAEDWTQVHKNAYLAALSEVRAKNLPLLPEYLGLRTTRSYTDSYFNGTGCSGGDSNTGTKSPEMKKILSTTNIYDYYPGGKKHHLRNIQPTPKIKASR